MNARSQKDIVSYITNMLSEFFVVTNGPYMGATEYNKKHRDLRPFSQSKNKMANRIHKLVTNEATQRFKLSPKKIGDSQMEIDLWSESDKIAYEILLSDGSEIWKDIMKAILVGASKLVVFCRNYPSTSMNGHAYVKNTVANLQPYLEGKLAVQVVLIQPSLSHES